MSDYKEAQAASRAALEPKIIGRHFGSTRRQRRHRLIDRGYTRQDGEKTKHIVMDHRGEVEKLHPTWTNHDRMMVRKAHREARRQNDADENNLGS